MTDKIPILSFEELPEKIAEQLGAKVERLGYLGEFFARTAHQPEALAAFNQFTNSAKGALDLKIVELIALTVATMKGVDYEKNQHERLSVRKGYGCVWVEEVENLQPESAHTLSKKEQLVQRFVIDATESDGKSVTPQLDAVIDDFGHEDAIAIMMVMARYTTHALLVNCMNIGPPVSSIFADIGAWQEVEAKFNRKQI
jgi:alkylhydroperoxidase family enzyme